MVPFQRDVLGAGFSSSAPVRRAASAASRRRAPAPAPELEPHPDGNERTSPAPVDETEVVDEVDDARSDEVGAEPDPHRP